MENILSWIQIVTCVILIISVLFQDSKSNNQSIYGGNSNQKYFKPKGKEAFFNNLTKLSGFTLFVVSITSLFI